ncbi:uncharacterized protein LOC103314041 isoform X1 [Tribolium castaneum]|uniref:uncharacterized protein LOC103314041 isoform X1 n=1 Tax=Tribolium castaneum TaxID=7070 RepID=UPI00077DA898|nr:PREDICTED: uncharacterized protein LOC103314041 isoform X1 [Tribolium castaneum]|eukprot:XP_015838414.1 PREDICTED: uncharacterized protein LOC103314041 isoform X1 [Tribolium castaneum]
MQKTVIALLMCAYCPENVFSLHCYTTDPSSVLEGNIKNLKQNLENCLDYIQKHKSVENQSKTLHCFTINTDDPDVVFKGCLPSNKCNDMINAIQKMIEVRGTVDYIGSLECNECEEDACNSEEFMVFTDRPTQPKNRNGKNGETSLKCHHCLEPCELTKAREKICGGNIGPSYEAVCTTEVAKNSDNPDLAVRKCQIIRKNAEPPCPESSVCSFCKSDMCTSSGGNVARTALLALALVYLGTSEFF